MFIPTGWNVLSLCIQVYSFRSMLEGVVTSKMPNSKFLPMHWGHQDHDQSRGVNQEQISHWWYPAREECRKQCSLSALCMSVCDHSLV